MSKFKTVEKIIEDENSVYYRTTCGCGSSEHDIHLVLEYDGRISDITLSMELFTDTGYIWEHLNWFGRLARRLKEVLRLLFFGRIDFCGEFIFRDEEHVRDFMDALKEGLEKMRKVKEKDEKTSHGSNG